MKYKKKLTLQAQNLIKAIPARLETYSGIKALMGLRFEMIMAKCQTLAGNRTQASLLFAGLPATLQLAHYLVAGKHTCV